MSELAPFIPFAPPCHEPGCARPAIFGENCFLLKGIVGTWWCGEHWAERQARAPDPPSPTNGAAPPPGQERLL